MTNPRTPRRCVVAALSAGAVTLSACAPVQSLEDPPERTDLTGISLSAAQEAGSEPTEGGTLVMGLSSEPDQLDPTTSTSLYTRYVMETVCQKLYDIDAEGEIVPMLATEMPEISEDETTLSFPIRDDAVFADGTEFDADAVVTTLTRHLEHEQSARAAEMGPVEDIRALDDHTVEVTFEEPFAPFTSALADRAGMIMSPTELEAAGDDFGDAPVCVGPFSFENRVAQTSIDVVADPLYYDAENVHLEAISYRIMADANIRAANIRSGDVQVADTISPQDVDALDMEEDIEVLQVGSLGYQGLQINLGNVDGAGQPAGDIDTELADDPRIRQALSLAIDREALANMVFNSWYEPACSAIPPESPFATEQSSACPKYDPDAAVALLEEAGVETPLQISVQVSNAQDQVRYAQALQASVEPAGFDLAIEPIEYTALLDTQDRGDYETILRGWSGRIDPHGNMYSFLHSGASMNYSALENPQLDELLTEATGVVDEDERAAIYAEAVTREHEVNSIIYLYRLRNLVAQSEDVAGIEVYPDGVVRLSGAAFLEGDA